MASASIKNHLAFWKSMAESLGARNAPLKALRNARSALSGTPFDEAIDALIQAVTAGESLWKAMGRQPRLFPLAIQAMTHAGEAGGVLDVIAKRIGKCLEEGTFSVPGDRLPGPPDAVRFWRAIGWLLASGVPVIESLEIVRRELTDEKWRAAALSFQNAARGGQTLASAMRDRPDLFPNELTAAVDFGEATGDLDVQALRIADALQKGDLNTLTPDPAALAAAVQRAQEESAPRKRLNDILLLASQRRASDIHLDPVSDGGGRVRLRIDGVLHDIDAVPRGLFAAVLARVKIVANLDHNEHQRPQLGRIQLDLAGEACEVRVSVVPVVEGERVVMRLLSRGSLFIGLSDIGLADDDLRIVRDLCKAPHGIVICAGPTGSGKTTLLYAMLNEINRDKSCVVSVEDPVEYRLAGVAQIPVRPGAGVTFAQAAKAALAQDPDVIMIGEIHDPETMEAALQCATTGHLVLTQFHAPTPDGAVQRMLDAGVEPFMLNSTLRGVIAQRLVRKLCAKCKAPAQPELAALPSDAVEIIRQFPGTTFFGPKGCENCGNTGYRGRIGIQEILIPDEQFRRAVCASTESRNLRQAALASGMKPMLAAGLRKAAQGITSIDEVCRVAGHGMDQ
jgi:type II secretory ATPase GspE/PulE/Tfp pilus assembly ATPase PilB-like protein